MLTGETTCKEKPTENRKSHAGTKTKTDITAVQSPDTPETQTQRDQNLKTTDEVSLMTYLNNNTKIQKHVTKRNHST